MCGKTAEAIYLVIIQKRCSEVNKHTHKEAVRTAEDLAIHWLTFSFLEIQKQAGGPKNK